MLRCGCTLFIFLVLFQAVKVQTRKLSGKITKARFEPLSFVGVEVKGTKRGTITKETRACQLKLDEGKYDLVVPMIGYVLSWKMMQEYLWVQEQKSKWEFLIFSGNLFL